MYTYFAVIPNYPVLLVKCRRCVILSHAHYGALTPSVCCCFQPLTRVCVPPAMRPLLLHSTANHRQVAHHLRRAHLWQVAVAHQVSTSTWTIVALTATCTSAATAPVCTRDSPRPRAAPAQQLPIRMLQVRTRTLTTGRCQALKGRIHLLRDFYRHRRLRQIAAARKKL